MVHSSGRGATEVLDHDRVSFDAQACRIPVGEIPAAQPAAAPHEDGREAILDFLRAQDGTVEAIIVRCLCGRELTLQCEYEEDGGGR